MADWAKIGQSVAGLLRNQTGLTQAFTRNGLELWGVRTLLRLDAINSDEGLANAYAFTLLCPAAQFNGSYPKARISKVTIGTDEMRVLAVEHDAVKATVRLHLGDILS